MNLDRPPLGKRAFLAAKRMFDVAGSLLGLAAASPVLLVVAVLIKAGSPGPIFFRQERVGHGGEIITVWKFRTMTDVPRSELDQVFAGHADVTRVGGVLRRFKIDELPQFFNILVGDMSFVGPRPGLPEQLPDYTPRARRRLEVRPGLTGLAQVSGNVHLSWPERWDYDARYVDAMSVRLDLTILLKTIVVVVLGERRFLTWREHDR